MFKKDIWKMKVEKKKELNLRININQQKKLRNLTPQFNFFSTFRSFVA